MSLTMKMKASAVKSVAWQQSEPGKFDSQEVELAAVYGGESNPVNQAWSKATPSAHLKATISNPAAFDKIVPGKEYIVEIREAREGE